MRIERQWHFEFASLLNHSFFTYCGVAKSGSDKNLTTLEMFLALLVVVPFGENAIWHYGQFRTDLEKRGHPIGPMDTMIAAHALAINTTLVTNNMREFARVEGLLMENWVLTA